MGSTTRSAIYFSVAAILFVSALILGFSLFNSVSNSLAATYKSTTNTDQNVYSTLKIPASYTVSGEEVFQAIYQLPEENYNIVVGGYTFTPSTDVHTVDVSAYVNVQATYKPVYIRDNQGNLQAVDYTMN